MNNLQDLLKRWAEREPNRCRALSMIGSFAVRISGLEHDIFFPAGSQRIRDDSNALVLKAALEAIHSLADVLRLQLENDGKLWHASLVDLTLTPLEGNLPIVPRFLTAEAEQELAVIGAYVLWLEFKAGEATAVAVEAEAIGGEG